MVEAAFDEVSLFVQGAVVAARLLPVSSWRDDGGRTQSLDGVYDFSRVVSLVGDDRFGLPVLQQADRLGVFGSLSSRNAEGYRQPGFVGQQVNLGAQSTSGTPQSLVFAAPFLRPVAAC